jgi:serine/threonine protein kinase/Flp pilus assembly protein TadD
MTASRPDNERIFHTARDIPDPDRRREYVREACGGDEARIGHVEALLAAADAPDSLLDRSAGSDLVATVDRPAAPCPGKVIGPYKLIEQIGEGGMGTVWMAQQQEPVKRLVAVKLIRAGMDSKQVIARFEAERQALALMEHPNIARVLDGGTTSAGRPYFVMDLVKGVPITTYCDEHRLTPRQRLELFLPVCQAVQHAHQKGIIHRDLKPSNVLVALYDGQPVPRVIDFGVAKAAGQSLTEKTLVTGFGAIVGTLEYMSPEQAELNQLDIDTRSDLYSLGVLLYELLAGSPPFVRKEMTQGGVLEMLRVIREQEPAKPSTKLSTAEGLPTLADNRGTEPAKLTRLVRGELDWIVMKALEKDRNRRYQTANAFALDVQRYLADEPVQACPPSAWYRARKFARRHKGGLALAALALFFLVLLGSGVGWTVGDRASRREQAALQAGESLARARKWINENKLALAHQELAEARGRIGSDRAALGSLAEQIEALQAELNRFESFLDLIEQAHHAEFPSPGAAPTLPAGGAKSAPELSKTSSRHAAKAVPILLEALSRYQVLEQDDGLASRGSEMLGSGQVLQLRRAVYEKLLWLADDVVRRQQAHRSGRTISPQEAAREGLAYLRKAEAAFRPTSGFYRLRARCRHALGQEEAARADEALARETPAAIALDHYLPGVAAFNARDKAEAVKQFEAALRVEPTDYWSLLRLGSSLGTLGQDERDWAAAAAVLTGCILKRPNHAAAFLNRGYAYDRLRRNEDALADYSRVLELDAQNAVAWYNRGTIYLRLGKMAEGLADFSRFLELDSTIPQAWVNRGIAHGALGQPAKALTDFARAIELKPNIVEAWYNRGNVYRLEGRMDEAIASYREAIRVRPDYSDAHNNLGWTLKQQGQLDSAIAEYREAIRLKPDHALAHVNLGIALREKGLLEEAVAAYRAAIPLAGVDVRLRADVADGLNHLAWHFANAAEPKSRAPARAVELAKQGVELSPHDCDCWNTLGAAHYHAGDWKSAVEALERSISLRKGADSFDHFFLAMAHWQMGHKDEAHKSYQQAVRWMDRNKPDDEDLRRFRTEAAELLGVKEPM